MTVYVFEDEKKIITRKNVRQQLLCLFSSQINWETFLEFIRQKEFLLYIS